MQQTSRDTGYRTSFRDRGIIPQLLSLKQAVEMLGGKLSVSTLRREVYAGRLRAVRSRPSVTARILIAKEDLLGWLDDHAAVRQYVRREVPTNGNR